MRIPFDKWPKLVFIFVPAAITIIAAAVLAVEYFQPDTAKAIRLVKESSSRKENFTVQQYLYSTLYHYKNNGEAIEINGWRAEPSTDERAPIVVEFSYTDAIGLHIARWGADVKRGVVIPLNEIASDLSWH
ncbi:MAG TPA: hypothetical protein VNN73_20710 [Blastocatellia bacterium]|nr:hypothetical protein [Blastocatellia bacterium]